MSSRPALAWSPGAAGPLLKDGDLDLSWQDRALCAEVGGDDWFPEKGGSTRNAKRVCLACEVRSECLDYALATDQQWGIWGGKSERERSRLERDGGSPRTCRNGLHVLGELGGPCRACKHAAYARARDKARRHREYAVAPQSLGEAA